MEHRGVVLANGGCDTALGKRARRREQRAFRENEHPAFGRGAKGGEEARDSASDDEKVGVVLSWCLSLLAHGSFRL
jgi:hypothetical protein